MMIKQSTIFSDNEFRWYLTTNKGSLINQHVEIKVCSKAIVRISEIEKHPKIKVENEQFESP